MPNATQPLDYVDYQVQTSPPFMQGPLGTSWSEALALIKDAYGGAMRLAVKARLPGFAPPDALNATGQTLQILRGFAPDDATYVAQQLNAWTSWTQAGTVPGMLFELGQARLANAAIWEAWYWSDGNPGYYFTITCELPTPWSCYPLDDFTWSSAGTWGDGGVWACGIPLAARQQLKALITQWKPAHTVCAAVIVDLGIPGRIWGLRGSTWGDGGVWGGATTLTINMTI